MYRFILVFSLFAFINPIAKACNCQAKDNSFIHLLESEYVFLATVMESFECGDNNTYEHELDIETIYKGTLPTTKKVYTDCITSCAFKLEKGSQIIFFTNLENNNIKFCELRIQFSDTSFFAIKKYLDKIKDVKLDYITLQETPSGKGFTAKMMAQDGKVNGVVNVYNEEGNTTIKGLVKNGKMEGYYEIKKFSDEVDEIWSGNYKNGEREGKWIYKYIGKTESSDRSRFMLYVYEKGEIIQQTDLSKEAQLEKYQSEKVIRP